MPCKIAFSADSVLNICTIYLTPNSKSVTIIGAFFIHKATCQYNIEFILLFFKLPLTWEFFIKVIFKNASQNVQTSVNESARPK